MLAEKKAAEEFGSRQPSINTDDYVVSKQNGDLLYVTRVLKSGDTYRDARGNVQIIDIPSIEVRLVTPGFNANTANRVGGPTSLAPLHTLRHMTTEEKQGFQSSGLITSREAQRIYVPVSCRPAINPADYDALVEKLVRNTSAEAMPYNRGQKAAPEPA